MSLPETAEYDNATENRLVLYALRDALGRLNYACRVVVHTECAYTAAAITQHWPEAWRKNGWKNSRGEEAKDADLWRMILEELEEAGHELQAERGKHEYSEWMRWSLSRTQACKNAFAR